MQLAITDDRDDAHRDRRLQELSAAADAEWRGLVSRPPIVGCEPRWTFKCPKRWDALAPTSEASMRYCQTCDRHVTFCVSIDQVRDRARAGACVAFDSALFRGEAERAYAEPDPMVVEMGEVAAD